MKHYMTLIATAIVMLTACGAHTSDNSAATVKTEPRPTELALPDVPPTLRTPAERAGWAIEHYWDKMDFSDVSLSLDTAFMEQSTVNFLSLFQHVDSAVIARGVDAMMTRAELVPAARDLVASIVERYLYDPESPMYNEEYFIPFMHRLIASPTLGETAKVRLRELLAGAMKNRPGDMSADFSVITREGKKTRLHSLLGSGKTILVFYDPDCETCHAVLERLRTVSVPADVRIVLVDAESDRALWDSTCRSLPAEWTVTFATTPVLDEEIYLLPAMPSIYLLDRDGRVILKDTPLSAVLAAIG